jgi:CheY-like chemotaxis protein
MLSGEFKIPTAQSQAENAQRPVPEEKDFKILCRDHEKYGEGHRLACAGRSTLAINAWGYEAKGRCRLVRILVADDNPAVRNYLRSLLEQQRDWKVSDQAPNGAEALLRIQENPPDLILLDFQMPDLDGIQVARRIRELSFHIPILMVTIHISAQLADEARKVGIRGLCAKWDVGSIVQAVNALLQHKTYFPQITPAGG